MAIHCDVCGGHIFSAQENYDGFKVDETFVSKCPYNKSKKDMTDVCYNCWSTINKDIATAKAYLLDVTMRSINAIRNNISE